VNDRGETARKILRLVLAVLFLAPGWPVSVPLFLLIAIAHHHTTTRNAAAGPDPGQVISRARGVYVRY